MTVAVKYFFLFIGVVIAKVDGRGFTIAPLAISTNESRSCAPQIATHLERVRKDISDGIQNNIIMPLQNLFNCGPGQWHRVAYLNMSDPLQLCPSAWREYNTSGLRACGRQLSVSGNNCSSVNYTSNGLQYGKVCGQVIGYQLGSTDVFDDLQADIDSAYVDGVSITHGYPRTHVWTYAAGEYDYLGSGSELFSCPCLLANSGFRPQIPPPYVGDNYYCESGNSNVEYPSSLADSSDLLWDGLQCERQCCSNGKSPPWFSVELPNATTDDIEVRLCETDGIDGEDTPIKILELYVQV